jgi:hypothetical protein
MPGKTLSGERQETVEELSHILSLTQRMALRLASQTHGYSYSGVRELNEILRLAREQMDRIARISSPPSGQIANRFS